MHASDSGRRPSSSRGTGYGLARALCRLVERWGIRRTNPDFWVYADFMNRHNRNNDPVTAGLLDLSRYENR